MSEPIPMPPTARCPGCNALVEVEHATIMQWPNIRVRYDATQTETDALADHMGVCPGPREAA